MRTIDECKERIKELENAYKNLLKKYNIKAEMIFEEEHFNTSHLCKEQKDCFTNTLYIINMQKGLLKWFMEG